MHTQSSPKDQCVDMASCVCRHLHIQYPEGSTWQYTETVCVHACSSPYCLHPSISGTYIRRCLPIRMDACTRVHVRAQVHAGTRSPYKSSPFKHDGCKAYFVRTHCTAMNERACTCTQSSSLFFFSRRLQKLCCVNACMYVHVCTHNVRITCCVHTGRVVETLQQQQLELATRRQYSLELAVVYVATTCNSFPLSSIKFPHWAHARCHHVRRPPLTFPFHIGVSLSVVVVQFSVTKFIKFFRFMASNFIGHV